VCTRTLPGDLLLADLSRTPLLSVSIVLLLTLLVLLILLPSGLLLLSLLILLASSLLLLLLLLTLLTLLILLASSLLLLLLLLTLLTLLILLASGLLLLLLLLTLLTLLVLLASGLLLLLTLLILLALGLLLSCSVVLRLTLLASLILLLAIRLRRLFLLRRFIFFLLFIRLVLPCPNRGGDPQRQKKRCRTDDSNWFHMFSYLHEFLVKAITRLEARRLSGLIFSLPVGRRAEPGFHAGHPSQRGFVGENEKVRIHSEATKPSK
jgi:hypothetical protein